MIMRPESHITRTSLKLSLAKDICQTNDSFARKDNVSADIFQSLEFYSRYIKKFIYIIIHFIVYFFDFKGYLCISYGILILW